MTEKISILICQTNPTVGDIDNNKKTIKKIIDDYQSDLIIFSELMLTGYPPEDLILKPAFMEKCEDAISELKLYLKGKTSTVILGTPYREDGKLYNTALVLRDGEIIEKHFKLALPNYGVFDEKRIFSHGEKFTEIKLKNFKIGLMVCEDIWIDQHMTDLSKNDLDLVVSINASPFDVNKISERESKAVDFSSNVGAPLVYVNQVGGQDEIVFDGNSFIASSGKIVAQLPHCVSSIKEVTYDRSSGFDTGVELEVKQHDKQDIIYSNLILGLRDYITKNKFPGVVLGISGGVDSAFSACVAVDALGPENVIGIGMPSKFTSKESNEDAEELASNLGFKLENVSIESVVSSYDQTLSSIFNGKEKDITEENIQSRTRGAILMAYSNKFGHMVLTNGNKSEVSVGYSTLYGDMCGGFSVVKDIYKSDLYKLAEWRNNNIPSISVIDKKNVMPINILKKEPTAELKENQKDSDSLPPYEVLDKILYHLVEKEKSIKEITDMGFDFDLVKKVEHLLYSSEYKRRQAAPGVKISERNFGYDRRYPITNSFRDMDN